MTHPHIYSSEQPTDVHYLPLKRKAICDTMRDKHPNTNIDESTNTTTTSDEQQPLDPDHSTKQQQSCNINSTMKTAPYCPSSTLESPLPPLPQIIRRTTRPCLLLGRTSPQLPTLHVRPYSDSPEQAAPRWHKQSYMLFLALRQHPGHALSRTDLIRTAMDLDRVISTKYNFPIVFGGKTPQNSASALLTNNRGRHFQSYRPSGSKSMHFRLAFEPADFSKAVSTYRQWMNTLITKDWPFCFGEPSVTNIPFENGSTLHSSGSSSSSPLSPAPSSPLSSLSNDSVNSDPALTSSSIIPPDNDTDLMNSPTAPLLTEFDEFIATRKKERLQLKRLNKDKNRGGSEKGGDKENQDQHQAQTHPLPLTSTNASLLVKNGTHSTYDNDNDNGNDNYDSICDSIPWKIQGDSDYQATSTIPTCWQDIVYMGNGNDRNYRYDSFGGVYAQRRLPINTPLGFYFGTPTVEDEFQLVKEEKGQAANYSLMYGRTVLDATDDDGQPFMDPFKELDVMFCPFHFVRQAHSPDKANVLFLKGKIYNQVICWTKRAIQQNEELLVWLKYE